MSSSGVLKHANTKMHYYIDDLSEPEQEAAGVCGWWSVKEIMALLIHLRQSIEMPD
ncbi:MAG: hypothetical protein BMS9Abin02_1160 [Anaerolineae bacterium]|nr:MAG: hypothetical protein BMS9Abin02_1160 [Anaerolineae bacterium]